MESTVEIFLQNFPRTMESQNFEAFSILLVVSLALLAYYVAFLQEKPSGEKASKVSGKTCILQRVKWTRFPLPVLDDMITLNKIRNGGVCVIEELVEKYGPVFTIPVILTELIAVSDPNIIHKLLNSTNIGHLNKPRMIYDMIFFDNTKSGLLAADVDTWSYHRKAISKAFTYNAFPTFLKYIHNESKNMAKSALLAASNNCEKTVDNVQMMKLLNHHAFKITTDIVMGSGSSFITDDERKQCQEDFCRGKELTMHRLLHPHLLIDPIWSLHPKKRELGQVTQKNNILSEKIINYYRGKHNVAHANMEKGNNILDDETDSLDNLTPGKSEIYVKPFECLVEKMIKAGLTNQEISNEITTFLIAGHETVVTAIELLMFHLATNTEHQEKCHLEVDDLFNPKSDCVDDCSNMEDLTKLKYLERCILESLRLTPTVPFFVRQLDTPLEIDNEFEMEAGQIMLIMPWIVHRNPEIYPNPKVFDPDRFLPENVRKRHSHSFIPFSMGMRNCVGWKIALLEMKVVMAYILRNFQISTTDELEDVKFIFDITLKTEKELNMMFKPRILK